MAYFTTFLQRQVNDIWRRKIREADANMRLYTTGKEIRQFLNDQKTLCTVGYVIRRHLQNTEPALLQKVETMTGIRCPDLTSTLNIPWPEEYVVVLAKELQRLSKDRGIRIARNTWIAYLDDKPVKMYKDTPFKVSFALKMSVETTEELLMASGQDNYCFRNPDHFIYYYCQLRPVPYDWPHAQELITRYKEGIEPNQYNVTDASLGMTHILRTSLKKLFSSPVPDERADHDLVEYMIQHQKEFSGLSLSAREDFLRMARYLSILYPTYIRVSSKKDMVTGEILETSEELPVQIQEDGFPKLSELVRSLFSTGGWLPTTVGYNKSDKGTGKQRTASSLKRREALTNIEYKRAPIDEEQDRPFLTSIQYFVDSYGHHLDAIERVFRRPANPGSVERRDIILFTYFFIRRYPELLEDEDAYSAQLDQLTSLVYGDYQIDTIMDALMEELYTLYQKKQEELAEGIYDADAGTMDYLELFNMVLRRFGMKSMYMPNPWDRFIAMSLFAEDPDFFTEAVLWNTVGDDYEEEQTDNSEDDEDETASPSDVTAPLEPDVLEITIPSPSMLPVDTTGRSATPYRSAMLHRISTNEYITVNKCCFVFGRRPGTGKTHFQDYCFDNGKRNISRYHAAILYHNNSFYLADFSSKHDTWLDQIHLQTSEFQYSPLKPFHVQYAYPLHNGAKILLKDEEFIFLC